MRKIINTSKKKLVFPKMDISIDINEIKIVSNEIFEYMIYNYLIREVLSEKKEIPKDLSNLKGRKKFNKQVKINK